MCTMYTYTVTIRRDSAQMSGWIAKETVRLYLSSHHMLLLPLLLLWTDVMFFSFWYISWCPRICWLLRISSIWWTLSHYSSLIYCILRKFVKEIAVELCSRIIDVSDSAYPKCNISFFNSTRFSDTQISSDPSIVANIVTITYYAINTLQVFSAIIQKLQMHYKNGMNGTHSIIYSAFILHYLSQFFTVCS